MDPRAPDRLPETIALYGRYPRLSVLLGFAGAAAIVGLARALDLPPLVQWCLDIAAMLALLTVRLFWVLRRKIWFWPATLGGVVLPVALIAALNPALLAAPPTIDALRAILVGVLVPGNFAFMGLHHWLDPEVERHPIDPTSRNILLGFGAVLLALILFVSWAAHQADGQGEPRPVLIVQQRSGRSIEAMRGCLDKALFFGEHGWTPLQDGRAGETGYDSFSGLHFDLVEEGDASLVRVTTARPRPLRPDESAAILKCTGIQTNSPGQSGRG